MGGEGGGGGISFVEECSTWIRCICDCCALWALVRGVDDPAFDIIEKPRPARIKPNTTAPGKMKYEPPPLPDEATA